MTSSDTPAVAPRNDYQLLRRLLLVSLVLGCAGSLSLNLPDPDLWGHTLYGEEWLAEGALPRTATHTYTAEGYRWINHENLAELALATGFGALGVPGMLVVKCLAGMLVLGMMARVARRHGVRVIATWVWLLLVASNLQAFWLLRPQLLSFVWCAVALFALDHAFMGWGNRRADFRQKRREADTPAIDWRWLAALPVLVAVWTNSHGGFLAGLAIVLTFLGGRAIESLVRPGEAARRHALGLAAVAAACVGATFLNPYGAGLHGWLLESLGSPRPEITEWDPPGPSTPLFWPFLTLLVATTASLTLSRRRLDPVRPGHPGAGAWQASTHLRHIAFFALLCGFWLRRHLQSVIDRVRGAAVAGLPTISLGRPLRWTLVRRAGGIDRGADAVAGRSTRFVAGGAVALPVDAIQWMADVGVRGKLVVSFNWAQYAIAALSPDIRVSCDGGSHLLSAGGGSTATSTSVGHEPCALSGVRRGTDRRQRELKHARPPSCCWTAEYPNPAEIMAQTDPDEWALVYQDAVAQVVGEARGGRRRGVAATGFSRRAVCFGSPLEHFGRVAALPRKRRIEGGAPKEVAARGEGAPPPAAAGG